MKKILIDELSMSNRTYHVLVAGKFRYISEVMQADPIEFENLAGMGNQGVKELMDIQRTLNAQDYVTIPLEQRPDPLLLKHIFIPATLIEPDTKYWFLDWSERPVHDIPVESLPLSNRTKNSLKSFSIDSVRSLLEVPDYQFYRRFKKASQGCKEIEAFFRTRIYLDEQEVEQLLKDDRIETWIRNQIIESILIQCGFTVKELQTYPFIISATRTILEERKDQFSSTAEINQSQLCKFLLEDSKVIQGFLGPMTLYLQSVHSIPLDQLFYQLPAPLQHSRLLRNILVRIEDKVEIEEDRIYWKYPPVREWLNSLPNKPRHILTQRMLGVTLEELGYEYRVTRERIRQIASKYIDEMPNVYEDKYQYWFEKYHLTARDMKDLFSIDSLECGYFRLKFDGGSKPMEEMVDDPLLSQQLAHRLQSKLMNSMVSINGVLVKKSRQELIKEFLRQKVSLVPMKVPELYDSYMNFISSACGDDAKKYGWTSVHAFESTIQRADYTICGLYRRIRYFPVSKIDIQTLTNQLKLERFHNIAISARILYREFRDLMDDYDIQNEYELHNLLNKTHSVWDPDNHLQITFTRMPGMMFGKARHSTQALNFAKILSPISLENLAEAYEEEYGVLKATFLANLHTTIEPYLQNGIVYAQSMAATPEQLEWLRSHLTQSFYFIEDVEQEFMNQFREKRPEMLPVSSLKSIGWKLASTYMFRDTYLSAEDYIEREVFNGNPVNHEDLDPRLRSLSVYTEAKKNHLQDMRYIEVQYLEMVSFETFQKQYPEVNREMLQDFVEQAVTYGRNYPFFSLIFLVDHGFDHPVFSLIRNPELLNLLIKNTSGIWSNRLGKTFVMSSRMEKFNTNDLIHYEITRLKEKTPRGFQELLEDQYGISLPIWKVKEFVKAYDSFQRK